MRSLIPPALLFLAASATASITGTLVHADGKPVAGATVRVYPAETTRQARARLVSAKPEREPLVTATTKDDGAFSIDTKGNAVVEVVVEVGGRPHMSMPLADGIDTGPMVLREATSRTVKVTSAGKPVASALVVFSTSRTTRTDAAGNFDAGNEGGATIIHPDYAIEQFSINGVSEVKLQKGVALKGRVTGANGPVAHAVVMVNGYPLAESGDDGTFTVAHAPASWRSVMAVAGNDVGVAMPSKAAFVDVRLRRGAVLSGSVRDTVTEGPVGGAIVTLFDNVFRDQTTAIADAKGRFTFDPLPSANYNATGLHWAYAFEGAPVALTESVSRTLLARPLARVRGRVIDEARKPVAGAIVSTQEQSRRTVTDADGNFLLRAADSRPVRILAMKHGYAAGASAQRALKPGETLKDLVITLPQGFPLQLRVIDRGRQPVGGVTVSLDSRDELGPGVSAACDDPGRDACNVTDAKGIVTYRIVEGEYLYTVRSERTKIVGLVGQAALNARSSPYTVEVEAGAAVSGRVLNGDGSPAANAEVTIDAQRGIGERRALADTAGVFTLDSLPSSKMIVVARSADGRLSTSPKEVTPPLQNLTLTLPRGGRVDGRVVERGSGRPVTEFNLTVVRRNGTGGPAGPVQPVRSDEGVFALDNVPAGTLSIGVAARGYVSGSRTDINVEEGQTTAGIEIQLERAARLTGRVTAAGKPLSGVRVTANGASGPSARNQTDADGEYVLDSLAPGERTLEFRKDGFLPRRKTIDVAAAKDARLDVELERGAELRGRVVDSGGAPVAGANVAAQAASSFGSEDARATTDPDGTFVMEGLADSRYVVVARKPGMVTAVERDVQVPASAPLTLTLRAGGTITGRVTGLQPNELAGIYVFGTVSQTPISAQTDVNGAFTLRGVPDGQINITASVPGSNRRSQPKVVTVENGAAPPVEIDFAEGFTVRGRVLFNGAPVEQGMVNFSGTGPGRMGGGGRIVAGSYEVSGLGAGDYRLMLNAADVRYDEKLTVTGSMTHDIDIRGAAVRGHVIDANSNAPISGASVSLRGKAVGGSRASATDSDGRFVLNAVTDGTYDVIAVLSPYAPAQQQVVVSGGSAPDVEVRLERGTPVLVKIIDASTGRLLGNVGASVFDAKGSIVGNMQRDEDGVRFYLRPGQYSLTVFSPGYVPQSRVPFSVPTPDLRVSLERAGSVAFRTNAPHRVKMMSADMQRNAFTGNVTPGQTPALETLAPGVYVVQILDGDGKVERSIPVTVVAGQTVTVPLD